MATARHGRSLVRPVASGRSVAVSVLLTVARSVAIAASTVGAAAFASAAAPAAAGSASPPPDSAPAAAAATDPAPLYQTIPAAPTAELTPANGWPANDSYRTWTRSLGGPTSNRFSSLSQINRQTVSRLKLAWTYHSGDGAANLQCNPIIVDGVMFAPTAGRQVVALNAATGKELWRFKPEQGDRLQDPPARRGLLYWPGEAAAGPRIVFTDADWIYALDPQTGKPIASFGEQGRTPLPMSGTVAGAVYRHVLVVPGFLGDVFGYDIVTGRLLWRFHTMPQPGEFGAETWARLDLGSNCWGGMALDESRGIAYISTGSPKPNYLGARHLGDNLFANCVIALNALTGERIWHFQEIRHDIWDLDIPAPPNLVTVMHDGHKVDAVAQVTKIGNTLLLDRVTGKPLFPFRLRRAPAATIAGEVTAAYQPDVELPERFVRHQFTLSPDDITDRTPEAHAYVAQMVARANLGWFAPFEVAKPTGYYGMLGGGEWTGAAFDPGTGRLYVSSNELPWMVTIIRDDDPPPLKPATAGERAYQQLCAVCHGPELRGVGVAPPLRGLRHRMDAEQILALWRTGRGLMPAMPVPDEQKRPLLDFLLALDRPRPPVDPAAPPRYAFGNYHPLIDQDLYPGIKPPWGTLTCLDLNSGRLVWQVPLGEYPELTKAGIPRTGTLNFSGAIVTAGGLVFCSGTDDNEIRAFDADTGAELWSAVLPLHGTAPPATYEVDGRQFVVIAATGGGKLTSGGMRPGPIGDAWVAFALDPAP